MNKEIYILGVGHNTSVYIDLVEACGYEIKGLYHYNGDRTGDIEHGYRVLGSFDDLFSLPSLVGMNLALSQGDNAIRSQLFDKILQKGGRVPSLIHPTAQVSRFAQLDNGVVIHINTVVHPDVIIGDNSVLSYNVSITHSTMIGNHCYIALGAMIGAYVTIADFAFIGIGANIISGKVDTIGYNAYVGAGALVTHSVEKNTVVAGVPARIIRVKS